MLFILSVGRTGMSDAEAGLLIQLMIVPLYYYICAICLCHFFRTSDRNMTKPMPLWYVRGEGRYVNPASDQSFDVSVTRVQKR